MAINYSPQQFAGSRIAAAGARNFRAQPADVGRIMDAVGGSAAVYAGQIGSMANARAAVEAAQITSAERMAESGVNGYANIASAALGAFGDVGAAGLASAANVKSAQEQASAAIKAQRDKRIFGLLGGIGGLGMTAYLLKNSKEMPFPQYEPPQTRPPTAAPSAKSS